MSREEKIFHTRVPFDGTSALEEDTAASQDIVIQGAEVHLEFAPFPNHDVVNRVRKVLKDAYIRQRTTSRYNECDHEVDADEGTTQEESNGFTMGMSF